MTTKLDEVRLQSLFASRDPRAPSAADVACYGANSWAGELVPLAVERAQAALLRIVEAKLLVAFAGLRHESQLVLHALRDVRQASCDITVPLVKLADKPIHHAGNMIMFETVADCDDLRIRYGGDPSPEPPYAPELRTLYLSTKLPEQQTVRAVVRDRATGLISQVVDAAV